MNLKGKNVYLREIQENDLGILNELMNDFEIAKNIVGWSKPVTMNEQTEWYKELKNDSSVRYAITEKNDTTKAIGTAIISRIDWKNRDCSIDIKLLKAFQGNGYGTEIIKILIKYIFEELNMNRISVSIIDYNIASQKIFEKNGFLKEGEKRKSIYRNGKYNSLYLYSILKEEYSI